MPYKITITEFHKSLLNTLFKWSNTIEIRFNINKTRERITTNIMDFSSPAKNIALGKTQKKIQRVDL